MLAYDEIEGVFTVGVWAIQGIDHPWEPTYFVDELDHGSTVAPLYFRRGAALVATQQVHNWDEARSLWDLFLGINREGT